MEVEIFLKSSGKFRSLYATSRSKPIDHTDADTDAVDYIVFTCLLFFQVGNQTATIIALCNLADFDLTAHFCQVFTWNGSLFVIFYLFVFKL